MADMDELMWPEWLGVVEKCMFCGEPNDVTYDPENPLAASWWCHSCGACGSVCPPDDVVPVTQVVL